MNLRTQLDSALGSAYRLDRELGGGGMSRIFLAEEKRLGRKVVIKVLSSDVTAGISAERFEREIRVAASLQQANIVPVLSAGDTAGVAYYTMPFVEGESLATRLRSRGALSSGETMSILRDLARALEYAHERGIIHRDIKPDNVLLSGGTAMVTDFGIAKAISASRTDAGSATLTQLGMAIGTPAYISPEQAAGDPAVDHRTDIYGLGCTAYEMLTGQPPFAQRALQRLLAAHLTEAPRPLQELVADVSPALASLVIRCLEKDPAARPQSAADILAALDTITASEQRRQQPTASTAGDRPLLGKALGLYTAAFLAVVVLAWAANFWIGLPGWVLPGAIVVMALGLPVILLTAYAQQVSRRPPRSSPQSVSHGAPGTQSVGTLATLAMRASPHLSWRRAGFGGVWAVGTFALTVAAFLLFRALGIGPAGSLLAAGKLDARAPVLIADFTTANTDSALGPVVSDAVRAGLAQSKVISLVPQAQVAATLQRMRRPPSARLDLSLAREVAERDGVRVVVDGSITGVAGGYIIALRLVTADSGADLASFRTTGEGPQGIIDAADRLSRELRSKIGESLRDVQATPPLAQVTTSSLEALHLYSEAKRAANVKGDHASAIVLLRRALAIDSNFAPAWANLAASLANIGGPRAAVDSAMSHAFKLRDRLSDWERRAMVEHYYRLGSHHDRSRALDALRAMLREQEGDSVSQLINMGEMLRAMREYARAESLDVRAVRAGGPVIAYVNIAELELDQGRVDSARAALAAGMRAHPNNALLSTRAALIAYARGNLGRVRQALDSLASLSDQYAHRFGLQYGASLALMEGQLERAEGLMRQAGGDNGSALRNALLLITARAWFGDTASDPSAGIASALARHPINDMALQDRPYFDLATAYARVGLPDRARTVISAYRAEVTDTALLRIQGATMHNALGEIALAEHRTGRALAEFRQGDVGYDGKPARECSPCLAFNLARAFDAAGTADSAIAEYEAFLATPYYNRLAEADPLARALAHERLGELYEERGSRSEAVAQYQHFMALWRRADPALQPRLTEVTHRIARLSDGERP